MIIQFCIRPIIIGVVINRAILIWYEGLNVSYLHVTKCAVVEVSAISTKENYFIVDGGGAAYVG